MKKIIKRFLLLSLMILCGIGLYYANYFNLIPKKSYVDADFDVTFTPSTVNYDNDIHDDYMDIMLGARKDAENHPKYDGSYVAGGYPNDDVGVCTDVVWRAFKEAGYNLKEMVDADIQRNRENYNIDIVDSNIDFRRVPNLIAYFETHAVKLTNDPYALDEWQAGDIVFFHDHVAVVSDKRNRKGISYIIHNSGQPIREEDALLHHEVLGHYRFDASKINSDLLIPW